MTDDVAELVLADNEAQTLALVIARRQALPMVNVHARYIELLETEGWLDRGLEFLPTDKQIAERQASGAGLQAPELAVLIAYTKNANVAEVVRSDLPDVGLLDGDLLDYFPAVLRERYADAIRQHPLRREIIATRLVNEMVNLSGISFDHRMTEDTGASVVDVTRAWVVAREVLDFAAALGRDRRPRRAGPARHPARPVPRLPADGRAGVAVAAAPPPAAARRRRGRRAVQAGADGAGGVDGAGARRADGRHRPLRRGVAADGRGARAAGRAGDGVAAAAHRVRPRRAGRAPTGWT